ncbi:MAG TPA: VWA domain-containing protein [Methylomirabilota bacterium]|nr:VWA domain-containing protein [Methylomirabilota bacterium]
MARSRDLTTAVLRFGHMLRAAGMPLTIGEMMDGVRALDAVDLLDRQDVYLALRTTLVARYEEFPIFDRCFETFWRFQAEEGQELEGLTGPGTPAIPEEHAGDSGAEAAQKKVSVALEGWEEQGEDDGEPLEVPGVSEKEILMDQDFSSFPVEDLDEVARLTILIAKRLARRISRRKRPTRRGGVIDMRRSFRANLMKGEIIELRRRERRRRKVRLVLLCDVSGSMDLYSRFLLQFLYALQNVFGRVETFTFSTRLTRVTEHLKGASYRTALARLTEVRDFSGGTRIGESLQEFNARWGSLVDRHTIVLLLSDGWDTGEPDILTNEMLTIKRKAGRLIWLNPLLGNPSYEPLTRGMAAALPLVDHFAAAHNLASLRDLAGHLNLR